MTPTEPTPAQHADLTRAMRRLRPFVEDVHEHGPWQGGWDSARVFALGPEDADRTIELITDATTALQQLGHASEGTIRVDEP